MLVFDQIFDGMEDKSSDRDQALGPSGDGDSVAPLNGVNGYSDKYKSDQKDKHRDKDRDKHRDKDKHRSKDHKSSSKEKDRDKDKHSNSKDKERHSSSHKSSSKDKDRDKDKHRDKDKQKDDKEKKSSSSSNKEKDREHKSSKDRDHKSSSSSTKDKDKDKERSKDKDRKDRDKDKSKDKDKDRKHTSSSGSKDKHRDKDRHHSKDKDRKDKHKEKERKDKKDSDDEFKPKVKEDIYENQVKQEESLNTDDDDDNKLVIKDEPYSQDESDVPNNMSQGSSCDYNISQFDTNESRFDYSDEGERGESESQINESQREGPMIKEEQEDSEEDIPLASRMSNNKRKIEDDEEDDDDDVPLMARKKIKKEEKKKKKRVVSDIEEPEEDYKPQKKKKIKKEKEKKIKQEIKQEESPKKGGRKKKEEEPAEVWKWWEEEKKEDGVKWNYLEHKGPVFAPPYEPLPKDVKFFYNGQEMKLSEDAEEIAGFYAKMLDHDYTTKEIFNKNFFKDWRASMTDEERKVITDLSKCNFKQLHAYFMDLAEKNRNRTKEEKLALKEKNEALLKEFGFCTIDGHKEKIGNFKIEPPGLFRGRGEHPKMGKLKRRVEAEDVIINCSKESTIPVAPPGHKWKEVRHDDKVTWLASWTENVQNQVKYIMLNPSSKLKGEKDWQKYETARKLHQKVNKIRENYQIDLKSKEMKIRQRAVALYFIDKLALRAGNEKDEDQADTVGCCSLRCEHIELHEEKDGKDYVVVFDFLGKDSIRYYNEVPVEKRVFKNLQLFMENKKKGDDLFDRAVPKGHQKSMEKLKEKIDAKRDQIKDAERQVKDAQREAKHGSVKEKMVHDKKKKTLERLKDQLAKLEIQETDRDENKTIALGTSKLNYLDPRISVAWCKKYSVPIEKIYNKTQRDKFRWAIDMAGPDYRFDKIK
ncbi:hypothetical protein HUJ05_003543 [Dendroctonus ponderosae]|nr:hypothetical protein HUJ05_003543 [Dendroctonus ponderosae]KAH1023974.1 hypothetical protein HUJ05_003543 [Dendroctonus ponderosae]